MILNRSGELWTILLAAGDGTRVSSITLDSDGTPVPKQFWTSGHDPSMLQSALGRALRLVPAERIVASVSVHHSRWWTGQLRNLPSANLTVQPSNRGTAVGLLLPLLTILDRDPEATVLVLPSDHAADREDVLQRTLIEAVAAARSEPREVVLVGAAPERSLSGYGWLLPDGSGEGRAGRVRSFAEKPEPRELERLVGAGAMVNTFIISARGASLLEMFARSAPGILSPLRAWMRLSRKGRPSLDRLYRSFPTCDFSRDVLERNAGHLRVLRLPPCGWSDLGTPDRLRAFLEARESPPEQHAVERAFPSRLISSVG